MDARVLLYRLYLALLRSLAVFVSEVTCLARFPLRHLFLTQASIYIAYLHSFPPALTYAIFRQPPPILCFVNKYYTERPAY